MYPISKAQIFSFFLVVLASAALYHGLVFKSSWNLLLLPSISIPEIKGVESFVQAPDNSFYGGTGDGRLINFRISRGTKGSAVVNISTLARADPNLECSESHREHECGRFLGLAIAPDQHDVLYGCNADRGLMMYNVTSGNSAVLAKQYQSTTTGLTDPIIFCNSLAVDPTGRYIYFTTSSKRFILPRYMRILAERDTSGAVLRYDRQDGSVSVLVENVFFANGIVILPVEGAQIEHLRHRVIYSELGRRTLRQIEVKVEDGSVISNRELVALDFYPDNLQLLPKASVFSEKCAAVGGVCLGVGAGFRKSVPLELAWRFCPAIPKLLNESLMKGVVKLETRVLYGGVSAYGVVVDAKRGVITGTYGIAASDAASEIYEADDFILWGFVGMSAPLRVTQLPLALW